MREFVAIDFETANEQRRSACSVGLVRFDTTGVVVDEFSTLIRPHPDCDYFLPMNTWIHGIDASKVLHAPTWDHVASQIYDFIGDSVLVAHNMAFDGYVLSDLTEVYALPMIPNRRMCTLRLARHILSAAIKRKRLVDVYDYYFPGEVFAHHQVGADARACGEIFARMQQEYSFEQLEELCPISQTRRSTGHVADQLTLHSLLERYGQNPQALSGEHVCITGTLQHGQRAAVQELVSSVGGIVERNMTKRTTILVIGTPNPSSWAEGSSASAKLQRATKLREEGSSIELVFEQEFFQRLADDSEA